MSFPMVRGGRGMAALTISCVMFIIFKYKQPMASTSSVAIIITMIMQLLCPAYMYRKETQHYMVQAGKATTRSLRCSSGEKQM